MGFGPHLATSRDRSHWTWHTPCGLWFEFFENFLVGHLSEGIGADLSLDRVHSYRQRGCGQGAAEGRHSQEVLSLVGVLCFHEQRAGSQCLDGHKCTVLVIDLASKRERVGMEEVSRGLPHVDEGGAFRDCLVRREGGRGLKVAPGAPRALFAFLHVCFSLLLRYCLLYCFVLFCC